LRKAKPNQQKNNRVYSLLEWTSRLDGKSFFIMKHILVVLLLLLCTEVSASVHMTRVDPALFIHQPKTDFTQISIQDEQLKRKLVEDLFNLNLLDHVGTKAYSTDATFPNYYANQKRNFWVIDLNADAIPEIVFSGYSDPSDDREFMEVYSINNGKGERIYREIGHLLAYKSNPNTNEVLLYHHQYPCCANASHNLNRLRLIKGKIKLNKMYFLGKETGLVGPFFPLTSVFTSKYKTAKRSFKLNWSPASVNENAWEGRTNSNQIAIFDSLSIYVELARQKNWRFILVKNPPKAENGNRVINTSNFTSTYIFGWARKEDLNN